LPTLYAPAKATRSDSTEPLSANFSSATWRSKTNWIGHTTTGWPGQITDEMWSRKSSEWETELETIRGETAKHEQASHDYAVTGSKILELAKSAHNLFIQQNSQDQARLLKTLLSNCTFDRGSLLATYRKPFDMLVEGNENGNWLGGRDSNPDKQSQSLLSYR
jgi:hypothetical protein